MFVKYKLALCLYKLYNSNFNTFEFTLLNFNQVLTGRQTNFIILKSNNSKVGLNRLANRLHYINNFIPLNWLNQSFDTYKIKCKKLFICDALGAWWFCDITTSMTMTSCLGWSAIEILFITIIIMILFWKIPPIPTLSPILKCYLE